MPLAKNQLVSLCIESLSSDGSGVGHVDGQAVFVPGSAPGDTLDVRIVKPMKTYAFGRVERIVSPGPGRIAPDCPVCLACGGCGLRHLSYEAECAAKTGFVRDAFTRIGGLCVPVAEVLPSPLAERYRNKVQLPVGLGPDGQPVTGFFSARSHRIVPCADCKLQPKWMNELAARACALFAKHHIVPYDEAERKGLVRHLFLREGWHSGQRLLCFVVNGSGLPATCEAIICETLQREFALTTVLVASNTENTNVILGEQSRVRTVLGSGTIEDTLSGVPIRMGVHEFYQVNTPAAEVLYAEARRFAALRPQDHLLDLYCGMGTIGLSMLPDCARLTGVEIIPQAVEGAQATARRLGVAAKNGQPARADFLCMDAGKAAAQLAQQGLRPDVITVDPPRKGCDAATLQALVEMSPRTLVMVSCNAATAARDVKWLCSNGFAATAVQPVDLFPRTKHVEVICCLSRKKDN